MPKVSIIIPTFNRIHMIAEALESAFAQTYKDYEIIVTDDGSTDGTQKILQQRYGDRIRYLYHENQGQAAAQNWAISQAAGEYIALLDDDDIWLPDKLQQQAEIMEKNPDLGFVCGEALAFRDNGEPGFHIKKPAGRKEDFEGIFEGNFIMNSTVLMRKKCFDGVSGFDERLRTTQDLDLWLRLSKKYKFHYMNVPLIQYRVHKENLHKNIKQKIRDHLYIFSKEENVSHLSRFQRRVKIAREHYDFVTDYLRQGNYLGAAECCLKAVGTYPLVGMYYRPKETHRMKFSLPYRVLKVYMQFFIYLIKAPFASGG